MATNLEPPPPAWRSSSLRPVGASGLGEQEPPHLVHSARLHGTRLQEVAVLGVMQLDHLAPAQVASEMRDALLLKRFSVILPSPEEASPQFGVRIDGDVGRLVDDEERQSPGCDLRIVGIGDARRTDDLAQRTGGSGIGSGYFERGLVASSYPLR